jgi:hypothetical protein
MRRQAGRPDDEGPSLPSLMAVGLGGLVVWLVLALAICPAPVRAAAPFGLFPGSTR